MSKPATGKKDQVTHVVGVIGVDKDLLVIVVAYDNATSR